MKNKLFQLLLLLLVPQLTCCKSEPKITAVVNGKIIVGTGKKAYLNSVNQQNLGVNILEFVGHGTLRNLAGIGIKSKISTTELEILKRILQEQLKTVLSGKALFPQKYFYLS